MKKWARRFAMISLVAALAIGVGYETSTHVLRGWLCGDAFYDGRPTSFWRSVIEADLRSGPRDRLHAYADSSPMNWWQSVKERLTPNAKARSSFDLVCWDLPISIPDAKHAERAAVLQELAADPNERIAGFAVAAPKCTPWTSTDGYWIGLLAKYSLRNP